VGSCPSAGRGRDFGGFLGGISGRVDLLQIANKAKLLKLIAGFIPASVSDLQCSDYKKKHCFSMKLQERKGY
jgi:hypothetical protein